jgi:urea ABC transporter permease protein UrtB
VDSIAIGGLNLLYGVAELILVSVGLAIVYGLMKIINFAHGEFFMLGAFAVLILERSNVSFPVAVVIAFFAVGAIGLAIERLIIRHLYGRLMDSMLATFGLSIVIQQLMANWFGTSPSGMKPILGSVGIGIYNFTTYRFYLILIVILILLGSWLLFTRTTYGLRARAATQAREAAETSGVNVANLNMLTFALGCAVAGLAGALLSPVITVEPYMGQQYLARVFMTVIVAGSAVLSGTVLAGSLLGATQFVGETLTTPFLGQALVLAAAILLVRFRPQGLSQNWKSKL